MSVSVRKSDCVGHSVPFLRRATGRELFFRAGGDWVFQPALFSPAPALDLSAGDEVVGVVYAVANDEGASGFILEVRFASGSAVGIAPAPTTGEVVQSLLERGAGVLCGHVVEDEGGGITVRLMYFGSADGNIDAADTAEWVVFDRTHYVNAVLGVDVNALGGLPS